MGQSTVDVELNARLEAQGGSALDDSALLAAALTAALVEYRRCVHQRGRPDGTHNTGDNWRMVACWERLRGGV